jgi:hypothetical protein
MQRYPSGIVRPLEKQGFTWKFETRRSGAAKTKTIVCHIVDRETGRKVLSESGPDELTALQTAARKAQGVPKPLTEREMAQKLAEAERRAAELESKLVESQLAEEAKRARGRPKKEDTTPADVPASEA